MDNLPSHTPFSLSEKVSLIGLKRHYGFTIQYYEEEKKKIFLCGPLQLQLHSFTEYFPRDHWAGITTSPKINEIRLLSSGI